MENGKVISLAKIVYVGEWTMCVQCTVTGSSCSETFIRSWIKPFTDRHFGYSKNETESNNIKLVQ